MTFFKKTLQSVKASISFKTFLIIYSLLYILLELAFRSRLLDTVGIISNTTTIQTTEILGRLISSFGIAILFIGLIKADGLSKKIIPKFSIYFITFAIAFYGQKFLIDKLENVITDEKKINAVYLQLLKENLFYGTNTLKFSPYNSNNIMSLESKVFFSVFSWLNMDNNELIAGINNNEFISRHHKTKLKYSFDEQTKQEFLAIDQQLYSIYSNYERANNRYKSYLEQVSHPKYKNEMSVKNKIEYQMVIYRVFNDYLHNIDIRRSINFPFGIEEAITPNDFKEREKRLISSIERRYVEFPAEYTGYSKVASIRAGKRIKGFNLKEFTHQAKKLFGNPQNICKFSNNVTKKMLEERWFKKINKAHPDQHLAILMTGESSVKIALLNERHQGKKYYICNTRGLNKNFLKIENFWRNTINKEVYGLKKIINNKVAFYNTAIGNKLLNQGLEQSSLKMSIPKNFNPITNKSKSDITRVLKYAAKKKLLRSINRSIANLANMSLSDTKEKYGEIPIGLKYNRFWEQKTLQAVIKDKLPIMTKDGKAFTNYGFSNEFNERLNTFHRNKQNLLNKELKMILSATDKHQVLTNNYVKSMILPIFMLFISSIIIFLNIVHMIILLLPNNVNKIIKYTLLSVFILLVIFIPLKTKHDYEDYLAVSLAKGTSSFRVLSTWWLFGLSSTFETMNVLDKPLNRAFDYIELEFIIDKIDESIINEVEISFRKSNLRKRMRE